MMNKIENCDYGDITIKRYKLFGFLPIFLSKKNEKYEYIKILGIPILKIKRALNKEYFSLFYFLPFLTIKKQVKHPYTTLEKHYNKIIKTLKEKIKSKSKIKVFFMVVFDSVFPGKPLFEQMLNDDIFEPYILIIPDISRGEDHMFDEMEKSYKTLSLKYPNVLKSWNNEIKSFIDYSQNMDIVCSANPYENMTNKLYRIGYLCKKNILPIYFNYGYPAVTFARRVASLGSLAKMWKVFSESNTTKGEYAKYMKSHGVNLVLAGYMKLDELAKQEILPRTRKTVIIAPHHTIEDKFQKTIGLSNFLVYADLFMKLPDLYPQIDFIFRPHPLLKVTLEKEDVWGVEKTQKYFDELVKYPNLTYQDGGDYFETFANSDGIIHDCSSFLAEYMFTGKPVCYMLRDKNAIDKYFMNNGKRILENCYQAYNDTDIISYLDNVVLAGKDSMQDMRIKFVQTELMVNYPKVSDFVLEHIKSYFLNNEE